MPLIILHCVLPYGLDDRLILALIKTESNFDQYAIGDDGKSFGLAQVQLKTARDMGFRGKPRDLFKPDINIEYSCKYLAHLYHQEKDIHKALRAYNLGPGAAKKYPWDKPWIYHPYVGRILKGLK